MKFNYFQNYSYIIWIIAHEYIVVYIIIKKLIVNLYVCVYSYEQFNGLVYKYEKKSRKKDICMNAYVRFMRTRYLTIKQQKIIWWDMVKICVSLIDVIVSSWDITYQYLLYQRVFDQKCWSNYCEVCVLSEWVNM